MVEGVERVLHRIEEIKRRFGDYYYYYSYYSYQNQEDYSSQKQEVSEKQEVRSQKVEGEGGQKVEFKKILQEVNRKHNREGFDSLIDMYSEKYGVDRRLVNAVIKVESNFNPRAISPKGALGLMQLMPQTAKLLGVDDPFSPAQNIEGGVRYLRSLLDEFSGNIPLALAAYNAGPGLVKRLGRIPRIPETEQYVRKVMEYYKSQLGS